MELGQFSLETMKKVFSELDRDKDGLISVADWRLVFQMMEVEVTDEELAEIMQLCDFDNSGSTQVGPSSFISSLVDATGGNANNPHVAKQIHNCLQEKSEDEKPKPEYNNGIEIKPHHKGVTVDRLMQDNNMKSGLYEARFILDSIMTANNIKPADISTALDKCIALDQNLEQKGLKNKPNHVPISDFFRFAGISRGKEQFQNELQRHLDKDNSGLMEYRQPLFRFYLVSNASSDEKVKFSWRVCDADDSALIDFEELLQMLLLTHPIIMTKQDAVRIFKKADFLLNQFDIDKNYELDRNEYITMAKQFPQLMFPNNI